MKINEVLEYAIKGITTEIQEIEKSILKGHKILEDRMYGVFSDKSPLYDEEIRVIIKDKQIKLDELIAKRNDISWELAML